MQVGQREPRREPLGQHLPHRHRVVRLQIVAGAVLDAILEQRHAPAGCQRRPHAGQHRLVLRHLVVDVGQDDPVDLAGGQLRIVDVAEHRDDAGDPFAVGEPPHDVEHLRLDVDAVDTAPGRDTPGHPARVVAGAAAHVGDDVAWLEPHRIEHRPGLLFLDAFVAFEPWRALVAHEVGRYTMPFGTVRRLGLGPRRYAAHRPNQHRQPTRKIPPTLPTGARVASHHRSHRDLPHLVPSIAGHPDCRGQHDILRALIRFGLQEFESCTLPVSARRSLSFGSGSRPPPSRRRSPIPPTSSASRSGPTARWRATRRFSSICSCSPTAPVGSSTRNVTPRPSATRMCWRRSARPRTWRGWIGWSRSTTS